MQDKQPLGIKGIRLIETRTMFFLVILDFCFILVSFVLEGLGIVRRQRINVRIILVLMNSSYFILRSSVNTIKITHGNHDYSILDFAQPMAKLTFLIALSLLAFSAASVLPHLFRKPLLCHPTMPLSLMHQRRIASLSQFLFQIPITNLHSMYI